MPEKPVIVDNSPLVHLLSLNCLPLLRELYREVWIPQEVKNEFLATDRTVREAALQHAPWIRTFRPQAKAVPDAMPQSPSIRQKLSGEDAVIALAQEFNARLIIIDERKARRRAERLDFPVTGVLGILVAAKHAGLIAVIQPFIDVLKANKARLSPAVIDDALQEAGET